MKNIVENIKHGLARIFIIGVQLSIVGAFLGSVIRLINDGNIDSNLTVTAISGALFLVVAYHLGEDR